MSRIHEALRKAEQEKAESARIDIPSLLAPTPVEASPTVQAQAAFLGTSGSPLLVPEVPRLEGLREKCAKPDWKPDTKMIVFTSDSRASLAAEQFRTLRTRLYQFREKHHCQRVLVTSSLPAEGKTFVATNLAHAIVRQHGRHVLLIDADLRASRLHLMLGAPSEPGLSEYLRGDVDESAVIQSSPDGNLFFLPAGKAATNPAELLAGPRLKTLLDRMSPLFDWIILDSPPAVPVADSGQLAGLCDGVLLVVRSGFTPYDAAKKACREFREKNLIGAVMNRAAESGSYSSYYYYYGSEGRK
jgi:protein-tyrosine kinase